MNLDLHFQSFGGKGQVIILMHGLFGSHRNWTSIARDLSDLGTVYGLDARNHGNSPHTTDHRLQDMSADLKNWILQLDAVPAVVLGHSMGGLAAMNLALHEPELFRSLIIEDIAPRPYYTDHSREFEALSLDISSFKNREEIDLRMQQIIPDPLIRGFLQMNVERTAKGYTWKINVPALRASEYAAEFPETGQTFPGPTLFCLGEASGFTDQNDRDRIKSSFPNAEIKIKSGGSHWLHYSDKDWFIKHIRSFLQGPGR